MWKQLAKFVIKNRIILLLLLVLATAFMGYHAAKIKLSYEFSKAIPSDNLRYLDYVSFKQKFGDDGNTMVIGVQSKELFTLNNFKAYQQLGLRLKKIKSVEDIVAVSSAVALVKDSVTEKLGALKIFPDSIGSQTQLDSASAVLYNLPFYRGRLYNRDSGAYLMAVKVNKEVLGSSKRTEVVDAITKEVKAFSAQTGIESHLSGLPLIRTVVADRIQKEMKLFLLGSLAFSVLILLIFFRSISTTLLSLAVVVTGVIWTVGITQLCGYQITLLTALIPSLVVVIGIPNCIYFINKYHTSFLQTGNKNEALVNMVSKMGVVTLFCNITAAIGFAVFAFTKSAILKEFGVVAGLSIMVIFVISFILLPAVLSFLPTPGKQQLKYLQSKWILSLLSALESWVFNHRTTVLAVTGVVLLIAGLGIKRLKTVAYIVDDLPKTDVVYKDLKFFERNFTGVMPLEIMIDTKKPKGILQSSIDIRKIAGFQDSVLAVQPGVAKPLSVVDGIKFTYQAISQGVGDSTYVLPSFGNPLTDLHKVLREIQVKKQEGTLEPRDLAMQRMVGTFVDSTEQYLRISMSMADIGTEKLPLLLDTLNSNIKQRFDSSYKITLTGTSITFLEGSKFIINGLKESIFWAFLLISVCMLYLFRSFRILICSLIPNLVPLFITAGIMGWAGVPLKPSTVLIFSVALGIAVDITIRFLVNYKQVLPESNNNVETAVRNTINQTGLSIVYTSLVLTAGFIIFCASSFGGTFSLGWLTSVTLLTATVTNLVLLPVLLLLTSKKTKN